MSNVNTLPVIQDGEVAFDFSTIDFDKTMPATPVVILSTMCANAAVIGVEGIDQIRIVAQGNKSKELDVQISGPETMLTAPLEYTSASATPANLYGGGISINISGTSMINGILHIDGRAVNTSSPMQLLVMVPIGTIVKIGMVLGKKVLVRDVNGALEAKINGNTKLDVDKATSVDVKIVGTGDFHCGAVKGDNLTIRVTGMGNARISAGDVQNFEAKVTGMGNISYQGKAVDAELNVSGMGSIFLQTCTGKLQKSKTGMGSIDVANKPTSSGGFESW